MTTSENVAIKTFDVSHLPETKFDSSAPIWWGNTLLLFIETTVFGCLIAVYFTTWMVLSPTFPPPQVDHFPVNYNPVPDLMLPTINLIVLLLSLIPGIWLDLSARKRNDKMIKILLPMTLSLNLAAIILRFYEFNSLYFRWDDNAYGSITWTILGMHLIHLIVLLFEDLFLAFWTFVKGVDDKHALDITVLAVYWYWVVGIWVLLYGIVYLAPRL